MHNSWSEHCRQFGLKCAGDRDAFGSRGGWCIGAIWATHYKLGERGLFYFFYSITAKVVFSVLDLLSVIVQSESSDSSRVSNGPASMGEFIYVENRPSLLR